MALRHPSPRSASRDAADSCLAHGKSVSQFTPRYSSSVECSNVPYTRFGQLRLRVALSACAAFFHNHVGRVVYVCAKKEMPWVHARRIVAAVKNVNAVRDWSIRVHPSHPVCFRRMRTTPSRVREQTVPLRVTSTAPRPTRVSVLSIDLRPEPALSRSLRTALSSRVQNRSLRQIQMRRVDTESVPAGLHYQRVRWDLPLVDEPGITVGFYSAELASPASIYAAEPIPASVHFATLDITPESVDLRRPMSSSHRGVSYHVSGTVGKRSVVALSPSGCACPHPCQS